MPILFLIFFTWTFSSSYVHDVPLAFFDLKESEDAIEVKMKFIKEDLEAALLAVYPNADFREEKVKEKNIEAYLSSHLRWVINNTAKNCIITQISEDEHHILISGIFSKPQRPIQRIEIYNTCLIEYIPKHSNIMNFHFHGKERMFRLHKKRIRTVVEY